jgi:hypothetical protein
VAAGVVIDINAGEDAKVIRFSPWCVFVSTALRSAACVTASWHDSGLQPGPAHSGTTADWTRTSATEPILCF